MVGWIKAAALIAGKDPVRSGYLRKDGEGLPAPHKQEGYIVHLGDHDWVLTSPASQKSIAILKKAAASGTISVPRFPSCTSTTCPPSLMEKSRLKDW